MPGAHWDLVEHNKIGVGTAAHPAQHLPEPLPGLHGGAGTVRACQSSPLCQGEAGLRQLLPFPGVLAAAGAALAHPQALGTGAAGSTHGEILLTLAALQQMGSSAPQGKGKTGVRAQNGAGSKHLGRGQPYRHFWDAVNPVVGMQGPPPSPPGMQDSRYFRNCYYLIPARGLLFVP